VRWICLTRRASGRTRQPSPGGKAAWRRAPTPYEALATAQVLIDFTRPLGTLAHLQACQRLGVRAVVGTTGFDGLSSARRSRRSRADIGIVLAPEHERGRATWCCRLLEVAARGAVRAATTSRSSRRTTATRWTRPAARR
jgi:4-hydroxy-tetrahydrodipicolinate reductase